MRINNYKLGQVVYHDQFFEYFNQLRSALNIQPDDNAILRGLQLSQSGTNVNVSAGWATGKPVFISFIKNNLGDTIRPCEEAVATGIALPDPFNGFVFLRFVMSSMVAGAPFYDVTTQLVVDTAPTAAFPIGGIIGEVCLGSVSRIGALITISNVGRDFDAAPSGSPVLANSYDASTDSPPLSGMSTPSFYRVATAGTQVINSKSYDLEVGDLVFRDALGYSVVRNDDNEGIESYDSLKPFNATDTLRDPATGDIYKCISAAPVGTALSNTTNFQKITQGNQAYNASTDSPAVASIPNGTELFVETAGTQTISGVVYDLNKGDLIKKSNAGTYSVIRGQISVRHIEKNAAYTLTSTDIPEDMIVGLHNSHATNDVNFTLPATFTFENITDRVDATKRIYTLKAGEAVAIRNKTGNLVEIIGDPKDIDNATHTQFGLIKTADNTSVLAQAATDEAITPALIPAITASDAEAQAMTEFKKFLTPANLDALRAVLADISDTASPDDKFMTPKHLVDWFTSAGRGLNGIGVRQMFPGGRKLFSCEVVNSAAIPSGGNTLVVFNFPVGIFSVTPFVLCHGAIGGVGSMSVFITALTAASVTVSITNTSSVVFPASAGGVFICLIGS